MSITKSDLLYYLDPRFGFEPLIGGRPSFSRSSQRRYLTRSKRYAQAAAGELPVAWLPDSAPVRRQPVLDLQLGVTPENDDSVDFSSGSAWARPNIGSESQVPSIFDALPSGGEARELVGTGTGDGQLRQLSVGGSTGSKEVVQAIIEDNGDGAQASVQLNDDTGIYAKATYDFATDSLTENAGTGVVETLTDSGPNGGRVVRLISIGTGNNDANRDIRAFFDDDANGDGVIVHYADAVELAFPTSPIPYVGSPQTRSGDQFYVQPGAYDSGAVQAWYFSYINRNPFGGFGGFYNHEHGDGSNPTIILFQDGSTAGQVGFNYVDPNGNGSDVRVDVGSGSIGQHIELVYAYDPSTGERRLIGRADGGAVDAASATPGSWSTPSRLGADNRVVYNEEADLNGIDRGGVQVRRHYSAYGSAMDNSPLTATAADVLDELANYYLPPTAA